MKLAKTIFAFLFFVTIAKASTFVGNGGNAGDVELQVTITQLTKTLTDIANRGEDHEGKLCKCEKVLNSHKICDSLQALNQRQVYYCGDTLSKNASDIVKLIQSKEGVQVVWTSERIDVLEKNGERQADAVAQQNGKLGSKIYLNKEQFLSLTDYERIFLLQHELGHLVKTENRFLRDDEAIGPFRQDDGGRQLLNSMAAAVTMKSINNGEVSTYATSLSRSKSYKDNWFNISMNSDSNRNDKSTFAISKYRGWSGSYRRQLTNELGITLQRRSQKGDGNFLTMTKANAEIEVTNLQLNLRVFPFKDPLSFIGQSHFILGAGYEIGTANIKVQDDFVDIKEKANLGGGVVSANCYFPIRVGLWADIGALYSLHHYEFKEIGFESQPTQLSLNIGVSYGF